MIEWKYFGGASRGAPRRPNFACGRGADFVSLALCCQPVKIQRPRPRMPPCGGGTTAGVDGLTGCSPWGTAMHPGLRPVGALPERVEPPLFERASPPVWAPPFFCQQAFSWLLFYWPAFEPAFFLPAVCAPPSCAEPPCAPLSLLRPFFSSSRPSFSQLSSLPYRAPSRMLPHSPLHAATTSQRAGEAPAALSLSARPRLPCS